MAKLFIITPDSRPRSLPVPADGAAAAEDPHPCPACGEAPCMVAGRGHRISMDDRAHEADGHCSACGALVGILRLEVETIFGLREDDALMGAGRRCRVYYG